VYHLLYVYYVHNEIAVKFSAFKCLLYYYFKLTLCAEYFPHISFRLQTHVSEAQYLRHRAKIQKSSKTHTFTIRTTLFILMLISRGNKAT